MIKTFNLQKFLDKKTSRLFIIGLSGAGKSTLGRMITRSDVEIIEFADFLNENFKLKMENKSAYNAKRAEYEKAVFRSNNQLIIPNITMFLRNELNPDYDFYNDSAIILDTPLMLCNLRGIVRCFKQVVAKKNYKYIYHELTYVPKTNSLLHSKIKRIGETYQNRVGENNTLDFTSLKEVADYINNY